MSDKKDKEAKPARKGGGMMIKIVGAIALLGVGAGGVFGLVFTGVIGGGGKVAVKEDNHPKLIRKGETDPFAPPVKDGDAGAEPKGSEGEGGSEYHTLYFIFSDDFTSNLKGTEALVQVSVACSTHRDYRVVLWLKKHELALRSQLLAVLADTAETDIQTPQGKDALQRRMTQAINKVLTDEEGFGGVDAVYFKNFIVQ